VAELRAAIRSADAVLFWTPEYAGSLPGSVKDLLDWTVGGGEMYGRPVAWINVSTRGPGGAAGAHQTLRTVLGYTGSDVVEAACAHIPVAREAVGPDGAVPDPALRGQVAAAVEALAAHVRSRRGGAGDGRAGPPPVTRPGEPGQSAGPADPARGGGVHGRSRSAFT
jgi:chromate reductase, NAD(P)H dehydrogenase (quinone)